MIGPLSTALLIGVSATLCWLLWGSALLVLALVVAQAIRDDVTVAPRVLLIIAACLFAGGWVCRWFSKRIAAMTER
ncbi:MAG: hypothetical protein FJY56_17760 [Betaproteobacteria bacterium]|nr:hypothetical protein [Betaproteobacteria bacterium]